MGRKIFSVFLIFALLMGRPVVCSALEFHSYSDVCRTDWYYEDVNRVSRYGYMVGTGGSRFSPGSSVTRAMAVTILGRMAGAEESAAQTEFTDVNPGSWYAPYVAWAVENGITNGVGKGQFAPEEPIDREQLATFLARFESCMGWTLPKSAESPSAFADRKAVSSWAADGVERMRMTGILRGDDQGNCNPRNPVTRAEAAAMISRLISRSELKNAAIESQPDLQRIVHAGGTYDGLEGSNSREALENAYQLGNRVIELDFSFTADGYLACIHEWNSRFSPEIRLGRPLELDAFLQCQIFWQLTPMWLEDVAAYMREHPDLYIVTDVKERNCDAAGIISQSYPDLMDRFIIQIYSEEEYDVVRELGFENIIFTLYALPEQTRTDAEHLVQFAKEHELLAYTFAWELCERPGYVEQMRKAGIPLLVHTVNDEAERDRFFNMGIHGVYTDVP